MGKKLLSIFFILSLFLLNSWEGFGQCPNSVSISSNPGTTICEGTEVTFTSNQNGGENLQYQWKINGSDVSGETSSTFITNSLSNGQKIQVEVTSTSEGHTECSISSSEVTMTVNSVKTPTVSLTTDKTSLCSGENITFDASNTHGGSGAQYEWFINGSNTVAKTGSSVSFSSSELNTGTNNVKVVLTSSLDCVTSKTAEAVSADFELKPDATISSPGNINEITCINTPLTNINFNIGGGGTGATVSGLPPGVSGSFNSETYTLSGTPTSAGEFDYTVTTTGSCAQNSATGTITVNPDATLSLTSGNSDQTLCAAGGASDAEIDPITYSIGETGTGANVENLPSGITGSYNNGTLTISGSSSETGTHNFKVTATGTCGNSSSLTGSITIQENLAPSVSISSTDAEICEGTSVTFTATPTNGGSTPSYQWKVDDTNVGSNSPTYTTNSLVDGDIVTVIMTSNETCRTENTATSNGISTTVNPNLEPSVSIDPSDTDFCAGDEVIYTAVPVNGGVSPTYEWKIGSSVVGSGETFVSSSLTDGDSITVTLTSDETCVTSATAVSDPVIASVNENLVPSVTIESNDDNNIICSGSSITFTATPTNGGTNPEYQWQINDIASGGVTTSNTFSPGNLNNGDGVTAVMISNEECLAENNVVSNEIAIQVDTSISGETPVWDNSDISFNPTAICPSVSGLIYKVEPIPGATSYDWTLPSGWTVTNGEGTNEITVTASVNASAGDVIVKGRTECGISLQNSITVTTGTAAHVDAGPDQIVCPATSEITLAGEIGGVITQNRDWDWFASVNGGEFTSDGFSNGGNSLDGTYTIPTSVQNGGTVTIRIKSVQPAGDCDIKVDEMTLTIESAATISDATNKNQTVCSDSAIEDISFKVGGAGEGAETTGLPAGITGNFVDEIYTLSGTPAEAGTFNYTVITTGNCENDSISGSITVNDRPTLNKPEEVFVCSGAETSVINFGGSSISGTTYEWANDNNSIGLAGSGTGDINSFTATNTTNEPITANITVTPSANNCEGTPQEFQITVYPTATFTAPENITVCNGENLEDIIFTGSTVNGSNYKWNNSNPAIGLGTEGTGNISSFIATNTTNEPIESTITVIPVANECDGTSEEFTITVNPTPAFSAPENQIICNGEEFSQLVFSGETAEGTTFNWTNDTPSIGLAASGTGNLPAFNAVNNGNDPITATISVIPEVNECNGESVSFEIVVNPTSTVETLEDVVICNGEDFSEIVLSSPVDGTSYSWTNSSPEIGLAESGTGNIPAFLAANDSEEPVSAVITVTPSANGCEGTPLTFDITVNSSAIVDAGPDQTICSNESATMAATLGGDASSGTWTTSGSGTFSNNSINAEYTPSASDALNGSVVLTYTSNDPDGPCGATSDTLELFINEEVLITTEPENTGICSTEPSALSVIASGDNLSYEWKRTDGANIVESNGIYSSTLSFDNTTSVNSGEYYVVVTGEDTCNEVESERVTINVDENIIIEEPLTDVPICGDGFSDATMKFIAHANGSPLTFVWYKDNVEVDAETDSNITITTGEPDEEGRYEGTLEINNITTDYNGDYHVEISGPEEFTCSTAVTNPFQLRLKEMPELPVVEDLEVCQYETPEAFSVITGTDLKWYLNEGDVEFIVNEAGQPTAPVPPTDVPGEFFYWVTQQPEACESEKVQVKVTVKEKPGKPEVEENIYYCLGESAEALSATLTNGTSLNWYVSETGEVLSTAPVPSTDEAGDSIYWVSQTSDEGCESDRAAITVTVHPLPEVIAEVQEENICLESAAELSATGGVSYIWYDGENEIGTGTPFSYTPDAPGDYTLTLVGTDGNGCENSTDITFHVETPTEGGIATGPESACIVSNEGTITLTEHLGEIIRWETSEDGLNWTPIAETSDTLSFQNITIPTQYRAVVKNGVCDEDASTAWSVAIDPEPIGGELAFNGLGRVIETCSNPGPEYNIPLSISGHVGEIIRWRYKEGSATEWSTVMDGSAIFTGTTLSPDLIRSLSINQSTIFEVEIGSGACTPNVFSQNATLSIVSSDIAPNPVTVTPGVVCLGEEVTLSGSTGYGSGPGFEEGGSFDFSSITNKGWRIKDSDGNESNFDSSADNGVAAIWLRTNPLPLTTANLAPPYTTYTYSNWDSSAGNEGNKGFAIVSGPNPSTLETSVFNLYAVENPVLTFDQGYNLTPGSAIYVDISTDGGATYNPVPLFELIATDAKDGTSGYYDSFGDENPGDRSKNKMTLDLTEYASLDNLRIRFRYEGTRDGDVWAVDAISLPVEPTNVDLTWKDYTDPENPVIIGTDNSEQWTPKLIGWNDFEIRTRLTFDSTGEQCETVENWETISVFVFDQYTSVAEAQSGSCGNKNIQLNGVILDRNEDEVSEFPTRDDYTASWEIISSPDGYNFSESHFSNEDDTTAAINDPNAVFSPGILGAFTLRWALERDADDDLVNESCPPTYTDVEIIIEDCIALDFDGVDDYVDLGNNYQGNYFFEAWIRPFDRTLADGTGTTNASSGTIISGPGFEIGMDDLATTVTSGSRWYHIAVSNIGELWVDGIPSGNITVSGHGGNKTIIGAKWNSSTKATENHFSGWIEEVRIWDKPLTEAQIRFMMNQRLYDNGAKMGVEIPMDVPGGLTFTDLAGYYQLLAEPALITGGTTPDLAKSTVDGLLVNMESLQENTAPLPYTSRIDGQDWATDDTWTHFEVWDAPNSNGIDGTPIEWNIVRTNHDIESGNKDITVLGLKSETVDKLITMANPGSPMDETNSGQMMRVTHYLLLDGNIDLVGESQLLQDSGSILEENSAGYLERDQQGKRNSFVYNYWSSPVSIQGDPNNSGYTVGSILLDGTNSSDPQTINFQAGYGAADGARTTPKITISTYWIWGFSPAAANVYAEWDHVEADGILKTGEGYTMKGTDGTADIEDEQNYVFRGKPHNGDFDLSIGGDQNYLVGNPYPSAIDAHKFIDDNESILLDGTIYFWDHFIEVDHILADYIGGYAYLNKTDAIPAISNDDRINATNNTSGKIPGQFIPVSQGIMVNTTGTSGGAVKFRNSQRIYERETGPGSNSIFLGQEKREKTAISSNDEPPRIRLNFRSPTGYHRQILAAAIPTTTNGFDWGYDALLRDNSVEDMFWMIDEEKYVIQAVPDFEKERVLPLGVRIKGESEFTFRIDTLENWPADKPLYLKDNLNDSIHDLRKTDYKGTSEPGEILDRFEIVFHKEPEEIIPEEPDPNTEELTNIEIRYLHESRELIILNPDLVPIDKVMIFDMIGKRIQDFEEIPNRKEVNLNTRPIGSSVYIVKILTPSGVKNIKFLMK